MNWYQKTASKKKEIDGDEFTLLPDSCGSPSGSMAVHFDIKKRYHELWIPVENLQSYNETCKSIKEDLKNWAKEDKRAGVSKVRIAQEFTQDAVLPRDANHLETTRNTDSPDISSQYQGNQPPNISSGSKRSTTKCEKCGLPLEEFEWKGWLINNQNGEEEVYVCNNCKHTNGYKPIITRVRKRKDFKTRRRAFIEAASPATPYSGWADSYNPANTPLGRMDLSEDQRVQPWDNFREEFNDEFDSQKQKNNNEYKVVKVKDKDGKIKFVRVKKKTTGGEAIQPGNTYTEKGRIKRQRRYQEDGRDNKKDNPGAWSHNRNLTGPGSGGYQMYYSDNMDADMRERQVSWYDHINNRGQYGLSRPY